MRPRKPGEEAADAGLVRAAAASLIAAAAADLVADHLEKAQGQSLEKAAGEGREYRYKLANRPYSEATVPEVAHTFEPPHPSHQDTNPFGHIRTRRKLSTDQMRRYDLHEHPPEFDQTQLGQRRLDQMLGGLEYAGATRGARIHHPIHPRYPKGKEVPIGTAAAWHRLAPDTPANRKLFRDRYSAWEESLKRPRKQE